VTRSSGARPGDGTVTVRVDSLGNTSGIFAVAGAMIRKDLPVAASPHVSTLVMPSFSGRVKFRRRVTENGSTESQDPAAACSFASRCSCEAPPRTLDGKRLPGGL